MAVERIGISRDLIIHPGEAISDAIMERGITQAELSARVGMSEAYISKVISGKNKITPKLAMGLEYALGVPKSFWLNLQANYEAELLEWDEENTVTEKEIEILPKLREVVKWLVEQNRMSAHSDKKSDIISLRKIFRVNDISTIQNQIPSGAFRVSKNAIADPITMSAWVRICHIMCEQQNVIHTQFNVSNTDRLISDLKEIMVKQNENPFDNLVSIMSNYGINFQVVKNIKGAPVHGYISKSKHGEYRMVLTIRGAYADIFWFTLFHELGHIVNGHVESGFAFIDIDSDEIPDKEIVADSFAQDALLEPISYKSFIKNGNFGIAEIKRYAKSQNVPPFIVIGRLQKEHRIPYSAFADYKTRYKWASSHK